LTVADVQGSLAHLLPASAVQLVRTVGADAALALLNHFPGVQIPNVPKHPNANPHGARRWAMLAEVMGEAAMAELAASHGGHGLDVPNCHALRTARRNAWLCQRFDALVASAPAGQGLSKNAAVELLVLAFAPITWRQVELIVDNPAPEPCTQAGLF
jgi:hypothetical protein